MSKQVDGAISCDVANFGDPMVGARKSCVCTPGAGPVPRARTPAGEPWRWLRWSWLAVVAGVLAVAV